MESKSFCYWLQGYFEIHGGKAPLSVEQVELIKRHLAMVFIHEIDPSFPIQQQQLLEEAHSPAFSDPPDWNNPDWPHGNKPGARC